MKKFFVIFLALTLALGTGCSHQGEQPTAPVAEATAPTTAPAPAADQTEPTETTAPAVPRTVEGTIQGIHIPAILSFPQRGDTVQVTGYPDEATATVTVGNAQGSLAKVLLRFDSEESYEAWQAYAKYNTQVFDGYTLVGEPLATLKTNTQMTVLDDLGECYLVQTEDLTGYIAKTQASKWRIKGSSSSAGSGSGSGGSGTGKDGGDISLTGFAGDIRPVLLADTVKTGAAQVRADGGRVVLKYFDRGDKVQLVLDAEVAPEIPGYALILEDGVLAYIPVDWVEKPGDEVFQPWEGYAGYQCKRYDNFELAGKSLGQLSGNKKITVLWKSGDVLLVQSGDSVSYIAESTARTTPIPRSSGGSSGSGGSGGGDWTPPKL